MFYTCSYKGREREGHCGGGQKSPRRGPGVFCPGAAPRQPQLCKQPQAAALPARPSYGPALNSIKVMNNGFLFPACWCLTPCRSAFSDIPRNCYSWRFAGCKSWNENRPVPGTSSVWLPWPGVSQLRATTTTLVWERRPLCRLSSQQGLGHFGVAETTAKPQRPQGAQWASPASGCAAAAAVHRARAAVFPAEASSAVCYPFLCWFTSGKLVLWWFPLRFPCSCTVQPCIPQPVPLSTSGVLAPHRGTPASSQGWPGF